MDTVTKDSSLYMFLQLSLSGLFSFFPKQCLQNFLYFKSRGFQAGSCTSCLHIRERSFQRMSRVFVS
ncbi:hypothetical protein I79_007431 [Cricetulus griseus]|uniref:Uncharacterized protein n=1 Tax=Cricetulus griseus TaxID=10029 RepID=G3HAH8_CRIGR|nr:hypothetical protein I79_007431 [Cricetulus griseus]